MQEAKVACEAGKIDLKDYLVHRFHYEGKLRVLCFDSFEEIETKPLVCADSIDIDFYFGAKKFRVQRRAYQPYIRYCDVIDDLISANCDNTELEKELGFFTIFDIIVYKTRTIENGSLNSEWKFEGEIRHVIAKINKDYWSESQLLYSAHRELIISRHMTYRSTCTYCADDITDCYPEINRHRLTIKWSNKVGSDGQEFPREKYIPCCIKCSTDDKITEHSELHAIQCGAKLASQKQCSKCSKNLFDESCIVYFQCTHIMCSECSRDYKPKRCIRVEGECIEECAKCNAKPRYPTEYVLTRWSDGYSDIY